MLTNSKLRLAASGLSPSQKLVGRHLHVRRWVKFELGGPFEKSRGYSLLQSLATQTNGRLELKQRPFVDIDLK